MRSDHLYLADIIEAADAVADFVNGMARQDFYHSELVKSAVLQKLIVIGEAATRLSPAFRTDHPQIEWRDIANFRNIAVHAYFSVDWEIVWVTAQEDVPELRRIVGTIVDDEFSGDE